MRTMNGILEWYRISWEWHRKGPISFIAKVAMFHNQGKLQDGQNLEILEGEAGAPAGWDLVINHQEME